MTHRRSHIRSMSLWVMALAFLVTACGGGDDASVETVPPISEAPTTVATTTSSTTTTTTTEAPIFTGDPEFDSTSSVSTVGIDVVTFGMTIAQAEAALDGILVPVDAVSGECFQVRPGGGPAGVELVVTAGTIERVDITNPEITTRSGAGVGMAEDALLALFGERLTSTPRAGGGNTIVFTPADAGDAAFRVIFETDGSAVTSFRSGRVPQVEPISPCG
ncbi:MAG: hypothetical protein R8J94_04570 [Acidimicrobiia bacterium]|nr:hypothetical protein [Acidimicrobiia bacterium]